MEKPFSIAWIQSHFSKEELMEEDHFDCTLLHSLIIGKEEYEYEKTLVYLVQHGLDLNKTSVFGNTPSHLTCKYERPRFLELLCCMGANISLKNNDGKSCLSMALEYRNKKCAKILIANGVRSHGETTHIQEQVKVFEQGVLRCRDVIVTLLGLKKKRSSMRHVSLILPKLDRFLIQQILAVEIWATRHTLEEGMSL